MGDVEEGHREEGQITSEMNTINQTLLFKS